MNKNSHDYKIARLATCVNKLRRYKDESNADINTKTSMLIWYAPTKEQFQCHIMGKLVHGDNIIQTIHNAESAFVQLYNRHFKTKCVHLEFCDFDENPNSWSKQRLIEEYIKMKSKSESKRKEKPLVVAEKRKRGRPRKKVVVTSKKKTTLDKQALRGINYLSLKSVANDKVEANSL